VTKARSRADVAIAVLVAALGAFLWWGASQVEFGSGYDRIGPRFFPHAVAGALVLLGVVLPFVRGHGQHLGEVPNLDAAADTINWTTLVLLGVALGVYVPLVSVAGFVPASALEFVAVARAFHSRRPVRDAIVGALLAVVVFYAFSKGLGLGLPEGPLERWLGS
jgi:putative tricarboxylic transport membrane protein